MLAIRMQRTGRKKHAMFRVVVQDSHVTPTSGKVIAYLGSYDPHTKNVTLDSEKANFYLEHGAHPSERVAALLKEEGVKLPKWVTLPEKREGKIRNPEKLRKNRPAEPEAEAPAEEAPAATETAKAEAPSEEAAPEVAAAEETPAEEPATEAPAAEEAVEEKPAETTKE